MNVTNCHEKKGILVFSLNRQRNEIYRVEDIYTDRCEDDWKDKRRKDGEGETEKQTDKRQRGKQREAKNQQNKHKKPYSATL